MAKYDALIDYLRGIEADNLSLTFAQIGSLLGEQLPESAHRHAAWWSNSPADPTHSWARKWMAAGWRASPKFADAAVDFRRVDNVTAASLVPLALRPIMELVSEAGIDVTEWKFNTHNQPVKTPRANPRFCYNWSFGNPTSGYVICVWHSLLKDEGRRVVYRSNIGNHLKKLYDLLHNASAEQRGRLTQQIRRAEAVIEAVNFSFLSQRPLRLILNVGDMRREEDIGNAASAVQRRSLDFEEWFVHQEQGGNALIVRGERPAPIEFTEEDEAPPDDPGQDDVRRAGQIRSRRGQPQFREKLLEAYQRRCAVTGCVLEPVLEAAHIVPHAEGTDYRVSNGILLRSDIHTLYDLHHLSIDGRGRIHLSREARASEYRVWEGKEIKMPHVRCTPSPANLDGRHARFLAKEVERTEPSIRASTDNCR
jgi:hypothetical protein